MDDAYEVGELPIRFEGLQGKKGSKCLVSSVAGDGRYGYIGFVDYKMKLLLCRMEGSS